MSIPIALALTLVIVLVAEYGVGYRVPGLVVLGLYMTLYALVHLWRRRGESGHDDEGAALSVTPVELPISGPVGRLGLPGFIVIWTLTNLLCLFNPFQLVQIVRQLVGNLGLQVREYRTGNDGRDYRTKIRYSLPFNGEWLLLNGGTTPATSHSWDVLGQRYALDFVRADEGYRRHTGRGTRPEDYYCYGQPVLAAADGRVVAEKGNVGTAPFLGWGICDFLARSFIGNHVLIKHAEGEYGLYAHLAPGSLTVSAGDRVVRGQVIGRCGHTGHSTEPHLHFHLQDSASLFHGMGLPVRFTGLRVDGEGVDDVPLTAVSRVRPLAISA